MNFGKVMSLSLYEAFVNCGTVIKVQVSEVSKLSEESRNLVTVFNLFLTTVLTVMSKFTNFI